MGNRLLTASEHAKGMVNFLVKKDCRFEKEPEVYFERDNEGCEVSLHDLNTHLSIGHL